MYKCALLTFFMLFFVLNAQADTLEEFCEGTETMLDIRDVSPNGQQKSNLSDMGLYAHAVPDYNGQVHFTLTGLPRLEDYPAEKIAPDKVAQSIDWKSDPDARTYRTRLTEGLDWIRSHPSKGLIGGKYTAIMHGCGGGCQQYWIVNVETGKVLGIINTNQDLLYRQDSRLLIANLYADRSSVRGISVVDEYYAHRPAIGYYEIKNDELSFFKLICTPTPWKLRGVEYKAKLQDNAKEAVISELKMPAVIESKPKIAVTSALATNPINARAETLDRSPLMVSFAIMLATVIDLPTILTLFLSWKSKSVAKVLLIATISALLGEMINILTRPIYEPSEIFWYRLLGQLFVGLLVYCIAKENFGKNKVDNFVGSSNEESVIAKCTEDEENELIKEEIIEDQKVVADKGPNGLDLFFADTKRLISFSLPWSGRTTLEKAYTAMFAIMLLGVLPMPYEFYDNLRVIVCLCLYFYFQAVLPERGQRRVWFVVIISLLILYNPILPMHIGDQTVWTLINAGVIYSMYRARLIFDTHVRKDVDDKSNLELSVSKESEGDE